MRVNASVDTYASPGVDTYGSTGTDTYGSPGTGRGITTGVERIQ